MFKNEHHVRIATILQSLDPKKLSAACCYFGGGTAIVLRHGEYRESNDLDFLVSDLKGYRRLRHEIRLHNSLTPLLREGFKLELSRVLRCDQYGIRTMIDQGGVEVKFEIVFEARVQFEKPREKDKVCAVHTLSLLDLTTSKILANSDRWGDDITFSRDLIDLAMLAVSPSLFKQAISKAKAAYGPSAETDLVKAIKRLNERPGRLRECMYALSIHDVPEAKLWQKISNLKKFIH